MQGPLLSIVAITRVSSKGDRAGRLDLADVRGSSDLVFEADQVILIQRDGESTGEITPTVVRVAKSRDVGSEGEVRLDHHYRTSRFTEPGGPPEAGAAGGGPGHPFAL